MQGGAPKGTAYSDFSRLGHREAGEGTPVGTPLGLHCGRSGPALNCDSQPAALRSAPILQARQNKSLPSDRPTRVRAKQEFQARPPPRAEAQRLSQRYGRGDLERCHVASTKYVATLSRLSLTVVYQPQSWPRTCERRRSSIPPPALDQSHARSRVGGYREHPFH